MSELQSLGKKSITYLAGTLASRLIMFLLLPLYTNVLHPDEFGFFDLSVSIVYLGISVLFFDMHNVVLRFLYTSKGKSEEQRAIVYSSLPVVVFSTLLYLLCSVVVYLIKPLPYFWLIAAYGLLTKAVDVYAAVARGMNKSLAFAVSLLVHALCTATMNLLLLLVFCLGLPALFISELVAFMTQLIFLEFHVRLFPNFRSSFFDRALARRMLVYAAPFCLNVVAYWVLMRYSRVIIFRELDLSVNGLYAVVISLSGALTLLSTNFLNAWQEAAFGKEGDHAEKSRWFSNASRIYLKILGIVFVGFLYALHFLFPLLTGPAFHTARVYLPLALCAVYASSFDFFLGSMFANIWENRVVVASTVLGALICMFLLPPAVRFAGADGASLAICFSFAVSFSLKSAYLIHKGILKVSLPALLASLAFVVVAVVVFRFTATPIIWMALPIFVVAALLLMIEEWRRARRPQSVAFSAEKVVLQEES